MTRRSYPRIAHGPIVACPCCKRELEVRAYFDGDVFALDDMNLHAELVPLREQPCRTSERRPVPFWPIDTFAPKTACEPTPAHVRGAPCNWLGPSCNDASHVTPCRDAWYILSSACSYVARGELVGVGHDTCIGSGT